MSLTHLNEGIFDLIEWEEPQKTWERLITFLAKRGFAKPDSADVLSIHNPESIRFWQEIIGAENWVLEILMNGLTPNFSSPPSNYAEDNNQSAKKYMDILREKVTQWTEEGHVKKIDHPPRFINPMTVATKVDVKTGKIKYRPCIDMSRCLNKTLNQPKVTLDTLSVCEKILEEGDFQTVFDLKNMYFHISLHQDCHEFFGFSLPNSDDSKDYFVFTVMCYGFGEAVYVVTRLMQPIKAFLHNLGIRFNMYIDDGRVVARSDDECRFKTNFTLLCFQLAGFNIQWDKTQSDPSQVMTYQGFITDTSAMEYRVSEGKITAIKEQISNLLALSEKGQTVPARSLASTLGHLISIERSHGSVVRIMSRRAQHGLGVAVINRGWETNVFLEEDAREELSFLRENLEDFNGHPIKHAKTPGAVYNGIKERITDIESTTDLKTNLFVSDASETHSFIYFHDEIIKVLDFEFDEEERNFSSGHRELLSILKTLSAEAENLRGNRHKIVYWQTDSKNAFNFLTKGSRKKRIQKDILQIKKLEKQIGIEIIPIWTPRHHQRIILADLGSKFSASTDEWGVNREVLSKVLNGFKASPTVDCFASECNKICPKFFSKIPQNGTTGVNFFAQKLNSEESYFCCPPPNLVSDTLKHIFTFRNVVAFVVFPAWKSANYWPFIFNGRKFRKQIKEYLYFHTDFVIFNR